MKICAFFPEKRFGYSFSSFSNVDFEKNELPGFRLRSKLKINVVNYTLVLEQSTGTNTTGSEFNTKLKQKPLQWFKKIPELVLLATAYNHDRHLVVSTITVIFWTSSRSKL